jgi:hypothetical protein
MWTYWRYFVVFFTTGMMDHHRHRGDLIMDNAIRPAAMYRRRYVSHLKRIPEVIMEFIGSFYIAWKDKTATNTIGCPI